MFIQLLVIIIYFLGLEEDEEKGDKKTVRQILSQLLSNNQPANQVLIYVIWVAGL